MRFQRPGVDKLCVIFGEIHQAFAEAFDQVVFVRWNYILVGENFNDGLKDRD